MVDQLSCCDWFQRYLERAGDKGASIIAFRDGDFRGYYIQVRPFDRDVVERYAAIDETTGLAQWPELRDARGNLAPFVSSVDVPMRFCPGCGADLSKLIRENREVFDRVAHQLAHLAS